MERPLSFLLLLGMDVAPATERDDQQLADEPMPLPAGGDSNGWARSSGAPVRDGAATVASAVGALKLGQCKPVIICYELRCEKLTTGGTEGVADPPG